MFGRKKPQFPSRSAVALSLGLLATGSAWADWSLDAAASSVQFISTKNNAVAEVHHFKKITGTIDSDGNAMLDIDLNSVDTLIPIRDERLREHLFQTSAFPAAKIAARIDLDEIETLPPGSEQILQTSLGVSLHGAELSLPARLRISAMGNGRYIVSTAQPLLLRAADFELVAGIEKLRDIAGLDSISTAVPVTVHLVWKN